MLLRMNKKCKNCGMPIKFAIDPTDFKWKPVNKDGSWHWDTCIPDKKYIQRRRKREFKQELKKDRNKLTEKESFTRYFGG